MKEKTRKEWPERWKGEPGAPWKLKDEHKLKRRLWPLMQMLLEQKMLTECRGKDDFQENQ